MGALFAERSADAPVLATTLSLGCSDAGQTSITDAKDAAVCDLDGVSVVLHCGRLPCSSACRMPLADAPHFLTSYGASCQKILATLCSTPGLHKMFAADCDGVEMVTGIGTFAWSEFAPVWRCDAAGKLIGSSYSTSEPVECPCGVFGEMPNCTSLAFFAKACDAAPSSDAGDSKP